MGTKSMPVLGLTEPLWGLGHSEQLDKNLRNALCLWAPEPYQDFAICLVH